MGGDGEMGRWEDGGRWALRVKSLRNAVQQRSDSNLAPLCGTAASRHVPTSHHVPTACSPRRFSSRISDISALSAEQHSKAANHGWLRCAAQQGSESLLAPLCGAAGLRVTACSAVRRSRAPSHGWLQRSRAPSHGWLRCAAQQRQVTFQRHIKSPTLRSYLTSRQIGRASCRERVYLCV